MQQWQELAEQYTDETGVPVTVLTAASGELRKNIKIRDGKNRCSYIIPGKWSGRTGKLGKIIAMI